MTGQGPPTTRPPRLKPDEVAAAQRRDAPPKARPAKGAPPKAASTKPPPPARRARSRSPRLPRRPRPRPRSRRRREGRGREGRVESQAPAPEAEARRPPSSRKPARRPRLPPPPKVPASRRSADGRVVVDSRLRARRVEVRIDEGRRRLRRIAWAAGVAATLVLLAGLTQSPLLAVRHVRVRGHRPHLGRRAAGRLRHPHRPADARCRRRARPLARLRRLPWVRTVAVKRQWPATVRITVTERHPVAQISHGKGWLLVDVHGRALAQVATPPAGLVRLVGVAPASPGRQVAHSTAAIRLTRALPASVKPDVAWIAVDRSGQLALRIRSGGKVVVGSLAELDAKMIAVATMLGHLQPHSFCTVDVQVPNAPTLTRASACA